MAPRGRRSLCVECNCPWHPGPARSPGARQEARWMATEGRHPRDPSTPASLSCSPSPPPCKSAPQPRPTSPFRPSRPGVPSRAARCTPISRGNRDAEEVASRCFRARLSPETGDGVGTGVLNWTSVGVRSGLEVDAFNGPTPGAGADVPDSPGRLGLRGGHDPLLSQVLPRCSAATHLPRSGLR
jgi:hypothetical protein